jgi:hypothetical protein
LQQEYHCDKSHNGFTREWVNGLVIDSDACTDVEHLSVPHVAVADQSVIDCERGAVREISLTPFDALEQVRPVAG